MAKLNLFLFVIFTLLIAGCEKYALDRQMEELCKKDGGVRVFETVTLPASAFDRTGQLTTTIDSSSKAPPAVTILRSGEYSITSKTTVLKAGDPFSGAGAGLIKEGRLQRYETVIQRSSDKKVLGTDVSYGRAGGEINPGHPSSNYCPKPPIAPSLLNAVFRKEE
jgi:hypothetical protein